MKNILIYSPQLAAYGGIEQHLCLLARHLGVARHLVTLITTSNSLGLPMRNLLAEGGCRLIELDYPCGSASRARKLAWLTFKLISLKKSRWDVIYTNGQGGLARVLWVLGHAGTRILHHHHTSADLAEQKFWGASFLRVLKTAPLLVSNSFSAAKNISRVTGRNDVEVLSYVTADLFSIEEWAEFRRSEDPKIKLGFCGRLIAEKGIDVICELSKRPELADISWHIHGSGVGYGPKYFSAYPGVYYHGPYAGLDDYKKILRNLDGVILYTKHSEGRPLALIEAMSAGLPWIATDRGGTTELAIDPVNSRLVDMNSSIDQLAMATRRFATDILSGVTIRVAQRLVYEKNFSPHVVSRKWMDFMCL